MVKGISRQVIVVQSPEQKLFDQAIFILKDGVVKDGVTDEELLLEAQMATKNNVHRYKKFYSWQGIMWACGGAIVTGLLWIWTLL